MYPPWNRLRLAQKTARIGYPYEARPADLANLSRRSPDWQDKALLYPVKVQRLL